MGIYEVMQEQYHNVMGKNPSYFKGMNLPVHEVSWIDALEFCRQLSEKIGETIRLPTEAEWEYSCRAGTITPFYFGDTISPKQANYDGNFIYGDGRKGAYPGRSVPVGSYISPNSFGL